MYNPCSLYCECYSYCPSQYLSTVCNSCKEIDCEWWSIVFECLRLVFGSRALIHNAVHVHPWLRLLVLLLLLVLVVVMVLLLLRHAGTDIDNTTPGADTDKIMSVIM